MRREKLQLHLFSTNLRGDAHDMMNILTPTEKDSWEVVRPIYIAKCKTKKEKKAKQKAGGALFSFKYVQTKASQPKRRELRNSVS